MATITGLTADRMLEIEAESVVSGEIVGGNLILTKFDGTTIDAGPVLGPAGPVGPMGPGGGSMPGEVRLWSGSTLPLKASYGTWVWADGAVYVVAEHPNAAANIGPEWRVFAGATDPGAPNFRVPDLRGLVPAGLDQMPGGVRANRMTRTVAITIAAKTGEETHKITVPELAVHGHGNTGGVGDHTHGYTEASDQQVWVQQGTAGSLISVTDVVVTNARQTAAGGGHSHSTGNAGSGTAHENVQPTVFVPYIVCLDG